MMNPSMADWYYITSDSTDVGSSDHGFKVLIVGETGVRFIIRSLKTILQTILL